MKELRNKVFSIRLTQTEMDLLKEKAESRGQTIGGFIRWIVFNSKEGQNDGKISE